MPINNIISIADKVAELLQEDGYNLYGLDEVITNEGIKNMYKLYINIPPSSKKCTIRLHFMFCPDHPQIIAGLSDARTTGIWIGLIEETIVDKLLKRAEEKNNVFNRIEKILESKYGLSTEFKICERCCLRTTKRRNT